MRKALVFLLALLLLIPQAYAAEDATALRLGSDTAVSSIYGSYEVLEDAADVSVTFSDAVGQFAYANFVDGKLWIAVASVESIDLSEPIGWVTATDAEGNAFAPTLEVASLKFDGSEAKCNLTVESVQAKLSGGNLSVSVDARDDYLGSYTLVVSAYDAYGKILDSNVQMVSFREKQETFVAGLANCAEGAYVKAFFLSSEWTPVATAEDREISK